MSLEQILQTYGYPALFAGTFLEGETPLVMAGFLCHRGYLAFPVVVVVAFCATFSGDQLFFQLGRTRGRRFLATRPAWRVRAARVEQLFDRYGTPLVLGFRFLYGLRVVTPFVIGTTGYSRARFMLLNAVGGIVWSLAVAALGYSVGGLASLLLGNLRRFELAILLGMALVSAGLWLVHFFRRRRPGAPP